MQILEEIAKGREIRRRMLCEDGKSNGENVNPLGERDRSCRCRSQESFSEFTKGEKDLR